MKNGTLRLFHPLYLLGHHIYCRDIYFFCVSFDNYIQDSINHLWLWLTFSVTSFGFLFTSNPKSYFLLAHSMKFLNSPYRTLFFANATKFFSSGKYGKHVHALLLFGRQAGDTCLLLIPVQ